MAVLIALIFSAEPMPRSAGAQYYNFSQSNQRHYAGTRYIALQNTTVHQRPDADSRVLLDLRRQQLIYAETADGGWLRVHGAGTRSYPDNYTSSPQQATVTNGRFEDALPADRDDYFPQVGYVRRDAVADMDAQSAERFPADNLRQLAVPQFWSAFGLEDRRHFALDLSRHPLNGVGVLYIGTVPTCSGFFTGNAQTFVTSAHCVTPADIRAGLSVRVSRSATQSDSIPVRLLERRFNNNLVGSTDAHEDWAILALARRPNLDVQPLYLNNGDGLVGRAAIRVVTAGVPGDLARYARNRFGYDVLTINECVVPAGRVTMQREGAQADISIDYDDCQIWGGDSGGAVMIWSTTRARFEVLGLATAVWYELGNEIDYSARTARLGLPISSFVPASVIDRVVAHANDLRRSNPAIPANLARRNSGLHELASLPGVAVLGRLASRQGMYRSKNYSTYSTRMLSFLHSRGIGPVELDPTLLSGTRDALTRPSRGAIRVNACAALDDVLPPLRAHCVRSCGERELDAAHQIRLTHGDALPEEAISGGAKVVFAAGEMEEFWRGGARSAALVAGSDVFVYDKATRVIQAIARNFMWFTESGEDVLRGARGLCHRCVDSEPRPYFDFGQSRVEPTGALRSGDYWTQTPVAVPGARTISAVEAWTAMNAPGRRPLVLAAMPGPIVLPGARAMAWAARPGDWDDDTQRRLEAEATAASGGDRSHPIITYCDGANCWLAYNLSLRLVRLGYTDIRWMRDGIEGWTRTALPLSRSAQRQPAP